MTNTVSLVERLNEHLASGQLELPVIPRLVLELQTMLSREDADIEEISLKIAEDQVVASQLLRVANSAFFKGLNKVSRIRDSIVRLGTREVTSLIFMITQQQQYESKDQSIRPYLNALWKHAASCAIGSKWLVERLGYKELAEEAFIAGLLHDIGKLLLLKTLEDIKRAEKGSIELSKSVLFEVLDLMHTVQGAELLQRWNLPDIYCDVVAKHHQEDFDGNNTIMSTVRLVNLACHKLGIGLHHEPAVVLAATPEGEALEISELLGAELEIMLEDTAECAVV
jgi:putative nucleotidyltransferase with HDIG domain